MGIHSALFPRGRGRFATRRPLSSDFLVGAVSGRRHFGAKAVGDDLAGVAQPPKHGFAFERGRSHCD